MKDDDKRTLTPRLRFPEFRNAQGWNTAALEKIAKRVSAKNADGNVIRVLTNSAEHGVLDQRDFFDRDIVTTGKVNGYYVVDRGDFVYNPRTSTFAPVGPISRNNIGKGVMSPLYTVFRFSARHTDFYEHYFRSAGWHSYLRGTASTGARHDRLSITTRAFMQMPIPIPPAAEQQKIAECLTSLDELIAGQGRKVEALKAHKKGLMQQLFPREGETLPRLRFPEYADDDRSSFKPIGDFAKVTTGGKDTQNKVDDGKYPFFVRSQNVERIDSFSHDGEAVLTSGDGVGVGKNYHYIDGKFDFHQRVYCIYDFTDHASGQFFFQYFSLHFKKRVKQMSAKNSVDSVRMSMITDMPIWLPEIAEQQRIADCLSALDALISAETDKLAALKTHKRGLMQQLFPSPEAV